MKMKITLLILTLTFIASCSKAMNSNNAQKVLLEVEHLSTVKKIDCDLGFTSEKILKIALKKYQLTFPSWVKYLDTKEGQDTFVAANQKWIDSCKKASKK